MNDKAFSESDKQKFVDFLNSVAKHARFDINTDELIKYFKLLAHMQQVILPKIEDHILELKRVVEAKEPEVSDNKEE